MAANAPAVDAAPAVTAAASRNTPAVSPAPAADGATDEDLITVEDGEVPLAAEPNVNAADTKDQGMLELEEVEDSTFPLLAMVGLMILLAIILIIVLIRTMRSKDAKKS